MSSLRKRDACAGYVPLKWDTDSKLSAAEREAVEAQRKDLWRNGVRTEPNLTRMAFEFAAVVCMFRAAKEQP
jgi:hypothetical protein